MEEEFVLTKNNTNETSNVMTEYEYNMLIYVRSCELAFNLKQPSVDPAKFNYNPVLIALHEIEKLNMDNWVIRRKIGDKEDVILPSILIKKEKH